MKKGKTLPHWLMVACCCGMATASMGLGVNSLGLFNGHVSKALGVGIGDVSMFLTLSNLTTGLTGPLVVKLSRRFDLRMLLGAAAGVLTLGYVGLSMMTALWQMYAIAVLSGFCKAMLGMVIITMLIGNWFEKRMGVAVGISLCASGLSGAVLNPLLNAVIEATTWRTAYMVCAGLNVLVSLPAVLYARMSPSERGLPRYGNTEVEPMCRPEAKDGQKSEKVAFTGLLLAMIGVGAVSAALTGMGSHLVPYATSIGLTSAVGAAMASMTMMGNTGSKLVMGMLCDAIGPKRACSLMLTAAGVGMALLACAPVLPAAVVMVGALMIGASYSMGGVGMSTVCRQAYGQERFAARYAYVTAASNIGSAVSIALIGYVYDGAGAYLPALIGLVVLAVCGFALLEYIGRASAAQQR